MIIFVRWEGFGLPVLQQRRAELAQQEGKDDQVLALGAPRKDFSSVFIFVIF